MLVCGGLLSAPNPLPPVITTFAKTNGQHHPAWTPYPAAQQYHVLSGTDFAGRSPRPMTTQNINILSRRRFLDRSLKTSLAVTLSTLTDIPFVAKRALAEGSIGLNGKKILFIWLRGANDGLNSVIPIRDAAYAASRRNWQKRSPLAWL